QAVEQPDAGVAFGQRVEVDLSLPRKPFDPGRTDDGAQTGLEIAERAIVRCRGGLVAAGGAALELRQVGVACRQIVLRRGGGLRLRHRRREQDQHGRQHPHGAAHFAGSRSISACACLTAAAKPLASLARAAKHCVYALSLCPSSLIALSDSASFFLPDRSYAAHAACACAFFCWRGFSQAAIAPTAASIFAVTAYARSAPTTTMSISLGVDPTRSCVRMASTA